MSEQSSEPVISVDGVYKKFSRSPVRQRQILAAQLSALATNRAPEHKKIEKGDFWALQDINFEVHRGEVLGVIGFNGAGKSTLLRVLAGLMLPDIGEVRVRGEIGALIELGAGMQASLSGRQNIFIKGALLGKTPSEMEALYPQIAEFSELGEFLSAPIKTYSSGMRLRLGFSIAVHMEPDVLLLDEILAVGDYAFNQKCRGRINTLIQKAGVIFVSHSMNDIRQICDRVIVLDRGKIAYHGPSKKAVSTYFDLAESNKGGLKNAANESVSFYGELYHATDRIEVLEHSWCDEHGTPKTAFNTWEPAYYRAKFRLTEKPKRLILGISVWTQDGLKVAGFATDMFDHELLDHDALEHDVIMEMPTFALNTGEYVSTISVVDNGVALFRGLNDNITGLTNKRSVGFVTPVHNWRYLDRSVATHPEHRALAHPENVTSQSEYEECESPSKKNS